MGADLAPGHCYGHLQFQSDFANSLHISLSVFQAKKVDVVVSKKHQRIRAF